MNTIDKLIIAITILFVGGFFAGMAFAETPPLKAVKPGDGIGPERIIIEDDGCGQ